MDLDRTDVVVAIHGGAVVRAAGVARGERAVVVADGDWREICLRLGCGVAEGAEEGSVLGCEGKEKGTMRWERCVR